MDVTMIQHPVGQGGMFSGTVCIGGAALRWVYDCGSNQQDRLSAEVRLVADGGPIHLLFLSHLDSDHVNGVDRLLAATEVREVVLPYLSATEFALALVQDAASGSLSGTFLEFVADPAKWLIRRGVDTVSFIKTIDEIQPDREMRLPDLAGEPIRGNDNGPLEIVWPPSMVKKRAAKKGNVQDIAAGATAGIITGARKIDWLFSPYAHKPSKARMARFTAALKDAFGKVLSRAEIVREARNQEGREKLKLCYEQIWTDHNKVSMSLYAGPYGKPNISIVDLPFSDWRHNRSATLAEVGWLMTGDADLCSFRRINSFLTYYKIIEDRVGVFVLPHHGSYLSFHPDLLHQFKGIYACLAVAGPNQYDHPHDCVRRHVNEVCGAHTWHHVSEQSDSGFGFRVTI